MDLEEYLEGLEQCGDDEVEYLDRGRIGKASRLSVQFGVYDNMCILVRSDYDSLVERIAGHQHFRQDKAARIKDGVKITLFKYVDGPIFIQALDYTANGRIWEGMCSGNPDEVARQQVDYNVVLILHPRGKNVKEREEETQKLADAVREICTLVIKSRIPACIPKSDGNGILYDGPRKLVRYDPE
jgi:hypothetical protein